MLSRNQTQTQIMVVLYQYLFYTRMGEEADLKELISNAFDDEYENVDLFAREVIVKTLVHQEEIDKLISDNLRNWTLDRMNLVCHAILLMAIGEYNYSGEKIDKAVIIDVAVELAKTYLVDQHGFVNALLDNVLK